MSASLSSFTKQTMIYFGTPVFVTGVLGGILNTFVFLSLRTFRQSSCAFYLTTMSIVNIGQLFTGLFSRIMSAIYGFDGTESSVFYCKFRQYIFHVCIQISFTCFCLSIIDQYFATCSNVRLQQLCNIKLARRLILISAIVWLIHGIPYLIFLDHLTPLTTNITSCNSNNFNFSQYRSYVISCILSSGLPVAIAGLFGLMSLRNIRNMAYRTIPLIRRELDKQLTVMVLVQVFVNSFTLLPFGIVNALLLNTSITKIPGVQLNLQFAQSIALIIYYTYFATPFYIYICASERFRKQLIYVLFKIHLNRWRQQRVAVNQVIPETTENE